MPSAARTGYTFKGWKNRAGGSVYQSGEAFTVDAETENVEFVAQWQANRYAVRFNGNGATGGNMPDQAFIYGQAQALAANAYQRDGHTFIGWARSENATYADYAPGAQVNNLTSEDGGVITLYAVWQPNTYTVVFHGIPASGDDVVTGAMDDQTFTFGSAANLNANRFARAGFTFAGWSRSAGASWAVYGDKDPVDDLVSHADINKAINLYTVWTPKSIAVSFDGNGATYGGMDPEVYAYIPGQNARGNKLPGNGFVRIGYTFDGWEAVVGGKYGLEENDRIVADEGDATNLLNALIKGGLTAVTLHARWKPNTYSIVFNGNGADEASAMSDQMFTYDEAAKLQSNRFEKAGHTFDHWNTRPDDSGKSFSDTQTILNATTVRNGALTFYAIWTPNTYRVHYSANGGNGQMADSVFSYDVSYNLASNAFTREGFAFSGWKAAGSEDQTYADEARVINLSDVNNDLITLEAQWSPVTCTIQFVDDDGVKVLKQPEQYAYGTKAKDIVQPAAPVKASDGKTDYTFTGWEPLLADVTGDMIYRATYNNVRHSYTVTWVIDGVKSQEVYAYGDTPSYQMGAMPVKASDDRYDYQFSGWDKTLVPVTKDALYEARFTRQPRRFTVTWIMGNSRLVQGLPYDSVIDQPQNPTREGYVFSGWDREVPNYMPANNLTFTAKWEKRLYSVRFVNYNGNLLQYEQLNYREIPVYKGIEPKREDDGEKVYTFTGWTPVITEVLGDVTYTAVFTTRPIGYIEFVNDDGTVLQGGNAVYGSMPAYTGATPRKAPSAEEVYEFAGWTPKLAKVTGDATYTATYTAKPRDYNVQFVDEDGTVLQSGSAAYGSTPVYSGQTPKKAKDDAYTYAFREWTPAVSEVTGDAVYTAVYYAKPRYQLMANMQSSGATSIKISWTGISNAAGYDIFFSRCNSSGVTREPKLIKTISAKGKNTRGKTLGYVVTGLKKKLCYKAEIRAYRWVKGKKVYIAYSPMVHAICNDSNRTSTNAKSIRLNTGSVYLKVGGSKQLKATVKGVVDGRRILAEEHAPLVRYSSSNEAVATVDDSGRIRAVGKGSCTICAMTANGLYKTVKVRVR